MPSSAQLVVDEIKTNGGTAFAHRVRGRSPTSNRSHRGNDRPLVVHLPQAGVKIIPSAFNRSICSGVQPNSVRISSLCCPKEGATEPSSRGCSSKMAGNAMPLRLPVPRLEVERTPANVDLQWGDPDPLAPAHASSSTSLN